VNPYLGLLEGQTRGATEEDCVPGPQWADSIPEERRLKPRVEILEFTDFECPFCARAQPTIERVLERFGRCAVRVTTVPKPLPFHPFAAPAARAAAAAALQGSLAHERAHGFLFEESEDLSEATIEALPSSARIDPERHARDVSRPEIAAFVEWGVFVGDESDARGTPTFFINGHLLRGLAPFETFSGIIEGEIELSSGKEGRWGDQWLMGRLALNAPRLFAILLEGRGPHELEPEGTADAEAVEDADAAPSEPEVHIVPVDETDAVKGPAGAPVTVVTFTEFQCPYCVRLHAVLKQIAEHYGDRVRFVAKQYPLPFHKHARTAAKAALCAQEQGHYWSYHEALFDRVKESTRHLADVNHDKLAKRLKLNVKAFKRCRAGKAADERIDAHIAQAVALGIRGTPTSFVNGFKLSGAQDFSFFEALIDAALGYSDEM